MRIQSIQAALILVCLLGAGPARGGEAAADDGGAWIEDVVPEPYRALVDTSLTWAGENAKEIEAFLKSRTPEQRRAASFLVAYMPPSDLAVATEAVLAEHLDMAFEARKDLPWSSRVSEDLFFHYVLPCCATQEPLEAWRAYLYERIAPRVRHLESMVDVALEVNRWCGERFTYKPSQRRDQGVFENLKRGVGRCEEMMILYMAAARSVGLPVRACSTPLWSTCDSNHAWVEVWCDGAWHYLGACEPKDALDTAWFTVPARRAPIVLSRIYGVPEDQEGLYRVFDRSAIVNTTSVYARTGKVVVPTDPGSQVHFYVFNFGSLRPFARKDAGDDGTSTLELGPGEYFVTTSDGEHVTGWGTVTVTAGETTRAVLSDAAAPEGHLWLRYPPKTLPPPRPLEGGTPEGRETPPAPETEIPDDIWKVEHFEADDYPEVAARIQGHELEEATKEALASSLGNVDALARAIVRVGDDDLDDLLWLITELPVLDRIEATPEVLFDHLTCAKILRAAPHATCDEETWRKFVLWPRMAHEPLRGWRWRLFWRYHHLLASDVTKTARSVNDLLSKTLVATDGSASGSWKGPEAVIVSGLGTQAEITCAAVGVLRALGIPARSKEQHAWAEFFDGTQWQPLFPLEPDQFASKSGSEEAARAYETPGTLALSFRRKGRPVAGFHDFAAIRLGKRYWAAAWPDTETDEEGQAAMKLPPGRYLFNTGVRNKNGDPYVFFAQLTVEAGEEVRLDVTLDMPIEDLDESDLLVRKLDAMPGLALQYLSKAPDDRGEATSLFVFFTLQSEPSKSMLPRIGALAKEEEGLATTYVYLGEDEEAARAFAEEHGLVGEGRGLARADASEAIEKLGLPNQDGALTVLPSILLVRRADKKILYWEEGFNLGIDGALQAVLERTAGEKANADADAAGKQE